MFEKDPLVPKQISLQFSIKEALKAAALKSGKSESEIVRGYAVGMLHQFRCVEVLSQGPAVAGSPPGRCSRSALYSPASNACACCCSSRSAE